MYPDHEGQKAKSAQVVLPSGGPWSLAEVLSTRGKSDAGPKSSDDQGRTSTITASSAEFKCEMSKKKNRVFTQGSKR